MQRMVFGAETVADGQEDTGFFHLLLLVQADSLSPQFYKIALHWLGQDPDGRVVSAGDAP